jgi:mevalonate kinase
MKMSELQFHARGKIMITGEYIVLKGADCYARPTNKTQSLVVQTAHQPGKLKWISLDHQGKPWFEFTFDWNSPKIQLAISKNPVAKTLSEILTLNVELNGDNSIFEKGLQVTTRLEWPQEWGLGSSSTLIALISQWLNTDPFAVQHEILGGSGYDIACAISESPILYRIVEKSHEIIPLQKNEYFDHHACFVWQGKKASTPEALRSFRAIEHESLLQSIIKRANQATQELIYGNDPLSMIEAIHEHESAIGQLINAAPIHQHQFKDFKGAIKSCGAWGGDFALFFGKEPAEYTAKWVQKKYGLTAFSANDLLI